MAPSRSHSAVTLAAQYVRMSTEHQQYSTANQADAIRQYASERGFQIVRTYADQGKSGLTIAGRPGLRQLLEDVLSPDPGFSAVLVFDISRWGRFQDADESAHYEYLCRHAGVSVHYCAEDFENDGGPAATIIKCVKRAMAGEYSRELSKKVFTGKCRLIELGYRQGGPVGYGLRRQLIDAAGQSKGELQPGEWKSIHTDRVVLTLGPRNEVAVVRRIYDLFVNQSETIIGIANQLNAEGIQADLGRKWTRYLVREVLNNEKYLGHNVFNRHSCKLKTPQIRNDETRWIRKEDAFPRLVDPDMYRAAQQRLQRFRRFRCSDEELIERLRKLALRRGRLSGKLIDAEPDCPPTRQYRRRFGSLREAYRLAGYTPPKSYVHLATNERLEAGRQRLTGELVRRLELAGASVEYVNPLGPLKVNGQFTVILALARRRPTTAGSPGWLIRLGNRPPADITVIGRMDAWNESPCDYHFVPRDEFASAVLLGSEATSAVLRPFRRHNFDSLAQLCRRCPVERFPCPPNIDLLPEADGKKKSRSSAILTETPVAEPTGGEPDTGQPALDRRSKKNAPLRAWECEYGRQQTLVAKASACVSALNRLAQAVRRLADDESLPPRLRQEGLDAAPDLAPTAEAPSDPRLEMEAVGGANIRRIPLAAIQVSRPWDGQGALTPAYGELAESVLKLGLLEPLLVEASPDKPNQYHLLRGRLRIAVLQGMELTEADCFVVDRGASYVATNSPRGLNALQEHVMVCRALSHGIDASQLASALHLDYCSVWRKQRLLRGIGEEAAYTLAAGWATQSAYETVRKVRPARQVEIAKLFAATQNFSRAYGTVLLAATPTDDLMKPTLPKRLQGLTSDEIHRIELESRPLEQRFLQAANRYGDTRLQVLVLTTYLRAIVSNPRLGGPLTNVSCELVELLDELQFHYGY